MVIPKIIKKAIYLAVLARWLWRAVGSYTCNAVRLKLILSLMLSHKNLLEKQTATQKP